MSYTRTILPDGSIVLVGEEPGLSADEMPSGIDAAKIGAGTVSNTEFGYLDGVAGPINPQLIPYAGTAGGSANALTVTVPGHTETAGASFSFRVPSANTGVVTIEVNGGSARGVRKRGLSSITSGLASGDLQADGIYRVVWDSANSIYQLDSPFRLTSVDIPSTINATTLGGVVIGNGEVVPSAETSSSSLTMYGGPNSGHAKIRLFPQIHSSKSGVAEYYTGSASGAAHSFFDKNAAQRSQIDQNGLAAISPVVSVGTSFTTLCTVAGNQALLVATVTGIGSILLEWDGTTLTKLAGVSTLVVAGSAGAGETAFRVSGGNLQAIVDTGTRNCSCGFSVRH